MSSLVHATAISQDLINVIPVYGTGLLNFCHPIWYWGDFLVELAFVDSEGIVHGYNSPHQD